MGEHEVLLDNNQENHVESGQSTSECGDQNGTLNGIDIKIPSMKPPDIDYLTQLLKDRKQLAAFSNIFSHVERLLDDEINRVRVTLFQCKFAREPLQLPEPVGEPILRQEKIFVPVKAHPDFNFVGRILGPRGMTAKQLESETGCKIMVRGKGSIRDKKKEDTNRGKANWEHLQEELHVLIQSEDTPNRNEIKIKRAIEEVNKLLVPSPEGEDELKKKQLMELAIINGTFRNGTPTTSASAQSPASAAALGQLAAVAVASNGSNQPALLGFDQRMLTQPNINLSLASIGGSVIPNNGSLHSPALAGAPLIMQQSNLSSHLAARCNKTENNQNAIIGSPSSVASQFVNGITAAQLAAIAQSQAAALHLQQLQSGTNIVNPPMLTGIPGFAHNFSQLSNVSTPSSVASANCLTTADVVTSQQQQLSYQHLLQNMTPTDSTLLTMQLAQLQQQQQQQQQLTNLMSASAMNAGNLSTTGAFTAPGNDQMTALAAAAAAYSTEPLTSISSSPYNNSGTVNYNNGSRLRRFIGQSRDHPYNKRDST